MTELRKVSLTWFNQYFYRTLLLLKSRQFIGTVFFFNQVFSVRGKGKIYLLFDFWSVSHLVCFTEVKVSIDVLWRLKRHKPNSPMIKKNFFFFFSEWELLRSEARSSIASINYLPHHCRGGDFMSGFVGCVSLSVVSYLASR